jgi:hypothetical protein
MRGIEMEARGERLQKMTGSQRSVQGKFLSWVPTSTNLDVPHLFNGYVGSVIFYRGESRSARRAIFVFSEPVLEVRRKPGECLLEPPCLRPMHVLHAANHQLNWANASHGVNSIISTD